LEAYSFILKNPIDLLITDLQMPKINGIELCLHVNDFTPTQVIFMSGYSEQIIESLQLAVTDYLHKPISFDRFEQAIQKALIFANMERKAIMNINDDFLSMDKKILNF
jgi:YesN/AraC family two-component response regulator